MKLRDIPPSIFTPQRVLKPCLLTPSARPVHEQTGWKPGSRRPCNAPSARTAAPGPMSGIPSLPYQARRIQGLAADSTHPASTSRHAGCFRPQAMAAMDGCETVRLRHPLPLGRRRVGCGWAGVAMYLELVCVEEARLRYEVIYYIFCPCATPLPV